MTLRLLALAATWMAVVAGLAGSPGRAGGVRLPFGLEWPEWGERLELDDLRHALEVHPPVAVERWLYNPRERTALGLQRLETGGPAEALAAFETAGRIAPGDREVLLNLGTARLLADHGDAVGALERAVAPPDEEEPPGAEAPPAGPPLGRPLDPPSLQRGWYNLGTAYLAADDPAGAVAAYEEALRRDPTDVDAKFNLELALRRVEERNRLRFRPPRETPGGERPGEEQPSEEPGGTEPGAEPEEDPDAGRDPSQEGEEAGTEPREGAPLGRRPLAGFEEQRDLSAAQAAALLDAVEDLERRQRRLEAGRASRAAGAAEEDW